MELSARNWLPEGAFSDVAVAAALSGPLKLWSGRWFADAEVRAGPMIRAGVGAPQTFSLPGSSADVEMTGRGKRALLEAALAIDLSTKSLSEADHTILDALARRIAEDLIAVLGGGLETGSGESARVQAEITLDGREIVTVNLPREAMVTAIKKHLGAARPSATPLGGRLAALGATRVVLEGVLGKAELALSDVQELGVGDVVILDRALSDSVELCLAQGATMARGRLGRSGGRMTIQL
jgi:flagellar motor switch/type III secretory pathway protein FliN